MLMLKVLYNGYHFSHESEFVARSAVTSFEVSPDVTRIGLCAFAGCPSLLSLAGLKGTSVRVICRSAFNNSGLRSLAGLPRSLELVGPQAFIRCHDLQSLKGLPFSALVSESAFENSDLSNSCALLSKKARLLGFGAVAAWVRDRSLVPGRRYAVLGCVMRAREQLDEMAELKRRKKRSRPPSPVSPLLSRVALLPDDLVREVVEWAHGDHLLQDVELDAFEMAAVARDRRRPGGDYEETLISLKDRIAVLHRELRACDVDYDEEWGPLDALGSMERELGVPDEGDDPAWQRLSVIWDAVMAFST
ncbi:hypothetical protein TeGR_g4877 [Tetraparma gracilis]|uniref:Uncharacterized protein n=1 Tax=Tetraparma gracilis TaxID=2962635 RepID=A0ABQ6NB72_9STRA|nr:hypothetical protein TeGR_g4877 [Tetraparma gracilis]